MRTSIKILYSTSIFFVLLISVTAIAWYFQDSSDRNLETIYVVIAGVPFLIYLILTGKLKGFKGGGIEIILRDQAEKTVAGYIIDEEIEIIPEDQMVKQSITQLRDRIKSRPPSTLSFMVGKRNYYWINAIQEYMAELSNYPNFRYIVFKDKNDKFLGYMDKSGFKQIMIDNDIVELIESGKILQQTILKTNTIQKGTKNKQALNVMDSRNVTELAVVDENERFLGTLSQDEIVRKVLVEVIREA